jgi:hypothetical protein
MAMALGSVIALARAERDEGRGWLVLAAALGAGACVFKVFVGGLLLVALGTAWLLQRHRRSLLLVALPSAATLAVLAVGSITPADVEGVRVSFAFLAPINPARLAFGLKEVHGLALLVSGLAWAVLTVGLRAIGIPGALRGLRGHASAASVLGALALWGWPIAAFVSIKADPKVDESFYFMQASGLALWLFAAPVLARISARSLVAGVTLLLVAYVPTVEYLWKKQQQVPVVIPAPAVRAMKALREASRPGDVVLMQTKVSHVPLPLVLAGRRVTLADYIGYWRQFASLETVARRKEEVRSFFQAKDPQTALAVARQLGASYVYLAGRRKDVLENSRVLEPVFREDGQRVYRIRSPSGDPEHVGGPGEAVAPTPTDQGNR